MNIIGRWLNQHMLFVLLAVATLFGYVWLSQYRKKLRINDGVAFLLAIVHTVIGVLCVKFFAFLESGEAGGQSLFGAVFFLPVIYFAGAKLTKRKVADVFDIFTILTVFTLMCARINCIYANCCLGTFIPWLDGVRWPTRETEIVFYLVLLVLLGRKVGKAKHSGTIYPLYMISYGVFRFIVEWLRESNTIFGIIHISHVWALVAIAVGAGILCKLSKNNKVGDKSRKDH